MKTLTKIIIAVLGVFALTTPALAAIPKTCSVTITLSPVWKPAANNYWALQLYDNTGNQIDSIPNTGLGKNTLSGTISNCSANTFLQVKAQPLLGPGTGSTTQAVDPGAAQYYSYCFDSSNYSSSNFDPLTLTLQDNSSSGGADKDFVYNTESPPTCPSSSSTASTSNAK